MSSAPPLDVFRFLGNPENASLGLPEPYQKHILTHKLANTKSPHADQLGRTLLHLAVWENNVPAAVFLMDQGADINALDDLHDSPFLLAGAEGRTEILSTILRNADRVLKYGSATSRRRATAVPNFSVVNRYGGNALIPACERGHVAVVELLLTRTEVDVDHVNQAPWTALLEVVELGGDGAEHVAITKLLIEHGADVNLPDGKGVTPLAIARRKGLKRVAALLEAAGGHE